LNHENILITIFLSIHKLTAKKAFTYNHLNNKKSIKSDKFLDIYHKKITLSVPA